MMTADKTIQKKNKKKRRIIVLLIIIIIIIILLLLKRCGKSVAYEVEEEHTDFTEDRDDSIVLEDKPRETNTDFDIDNKTIDNVENNDKPNIKQICTQHVWILIGTKESTCSEKGYNKYKCQFCGETKTSPLELIDHNYNIEVVYPTCTNEGYTEYKCTNCGKKYKDDYTSALGHDYDSIEIEPTCLEKGYTSHTCSRCGKVTKDNEVDALGHNYEFDREDLPAIDNGNGVTKHYRYMKCSRCEDEYREFWYTDFAYVGNVQQFVIEVDGIYDLEAWGAQGGNGGGKGGYIKGQVKLHQGDLLYITVGGKGGDGGSNVTAGGAGFNGGGAGGKGSSARTGGTGKKYYYGGGGGGGGATCMATTDGILTNHLKDEFDINGLIVAGGGGGRNQEYAIDNAANGGQESNSITPIENKTFGQGTNPPGKAQYSVYQDNYHGAQGNGGGGGGYWGGYTSSATGKGSNDNGNGGTSFANTNENANILVENAVFQIGVQSGNGKDKISYYSELPKDN